VFLDDTFCGKHALKDVLIKSYGSVINAVASMTVFPPKSIVNSLGAHAVCNAVRISKQHSSLGKQCGEKVPIAEGGEAMLDENCIPDGIFKFCFKPSVSRSIKRNNAYTQLNHIYQCAGRGPDYFANLANLCLTPNFIAKLTDEDETIQKMLQYRAFQLYCFNPEGFDFSEQAEEFSSLSWFEMPIQNVASFEEFRNKFFAKKDKWFKAARGCGVNEAFGITES